jgi:hypothetical protein
MAAAILPPEGEHLTASDSGQPVYERLDYVRVERWTVWVRS